MSILKQKLRETLINRSIAKAAKETKLKNFKVDDLVVHFADTNQVYEIQTLNQVIATLAPFDDNSAKKEILITLPLNELIGVNDILRNYTISVFEFNKTKSKKIVLC